MTQKTVTFTYSEMPIGELDSVAAEVAAAARQAVNGSYSPYSHFKVGAAVRTADGAITPGANQENAAYPSGICAERNALWSAAANHPGQPITHIAIAAADEDGPTAWPITPCGACRQAIMEYEHLYRRPITLILLSADKALVISSMKDLLPLTFTEF